MTSPPVISHAYTNFQFFSSLSLLSSPTIREEIRIHPNARLLSLIFFFSITKPIIDSPISVANGLLFSKNSSGITRALPLGAHLAVSLVYTRTHTHARRRRTCSPRGNATPISLQRSNCCARGKNSEDEKEERTRKRVSRPRESNKFDTRTLSLSLFLSLYLSLCALSSVFKPVLEPRDFIAGLFVPIARTTGRSYSKFSARIGGACERARRVYNGWRETGDITRALLTHQGTHVRQGRQGYTHCSLTAANPLTRGLKSSSFLSASPLARCQCQLIVAGEEEPVARFYALPR